MSERQIEEKMLEFMEKHNKHNFVVGYADRLNAYTISCENCNEKHLYFLCADWDLDVAVNILVSDKFLCKIFTTIIENREFDKKQLIEIIKECDKAIKHRKGK